MGQSSPPSAPQRSQFYNIVCGGTWLNRQQWDDAVAQFKTDNSVHADTQAQTLTLQRQSEAPTVNRTFRPVILDTVFPVLRPVFQAVLVPAYAFFSQLQQRIQAAATELTGLRTAIPRTFQQEPNALAQMLNYFFGNRREVVRPSTLLTEEEQQSRAQVDFLAGQVETFQLNKVGKSGGSSLSGGGGQGGQSAS